MEMADRIQRLRKESGLSQEELADKMGVSRQAVSKWESGQSAPDLEKVLFMSDFFGVTTDYLLKGTEPTCQTVIPAKEKPDAGVFTAAATALNLLGWVLAAAIFYERQTAIAAAVGFIPIIAGCTLYGIGMNLSDEKTRGRAKRSFWKLNCWILSLPLFSFACNLLCGAPGLAPYPVPVGGIWKYAAFWFFYFILNMLVDGWLCRQKKREASQNGSRQE
ncbi:MAG: helix-turn-helix transcriptional regulator [Provencibacterium sp.]|nr:helix-turn-helix transcriptional regulator [Provencibacterium sp.]